eukprot:5464993-Prymnesium_polylepis.1
MPIRVRLWGAAVGVRRSGGRALRRWPSMLFAVGCRCDCGGGGGGGNAHSGGARGGGVARG